ncbi:uncharacterized protein I206_106502 [Kwoniella pini CBS 10737]|uniref:Uncharacterized protein n=1 Tax=Kwoniella pini CBS 10737 TaxID=1296096 RepID=A0A1B9HUI2_9TREE|nr:uncharacterized protein I206_07307 [Kwoniella pini CBS 10737]OCF46920.1 hypothetical protein I206_07307 [Kwoniella pini CBS 10737]
MCESIPSVTLYGTTQLTTTLTTSTIITTQLSQQIKLLTSQIITKEIITSIIPQKTLYYPCSETEIIKPSSTSKQLLQTTLSSNLNENSIDLNATGQFTGSLPTQIKFTSKSSSFTSSLVKSSVVTSKSSSQLTTSTSTLTQLPLITSSRSDNVTNVNSSAEESNTTTKSNAGTIAGGVIGGIFALIIFIILLMCCQKRRARRRIKGGSWRDSSITPFHGGQSGNDYWEKRFREIESANSSRGNELGTNRINETEKGDWDSQTSKKLRLTLDLGSKDLPSRPPSRLSMISSFFGGRMTPTPNITSSFHHSRNGSTPTLRSTMPKTSKNRFSFNPFKRNNNTNNNYYYYNKNQFNNHNQDFNKSQISLPKQNHQHNRSISSPWIQEDSKSFKSGSGTNSNGIKSAGYSNSIKSPKARPSLEDNLNINRNTSVKLNNNNNNNNNNVDKRRSQNTFGKKLSSFDLPITKEEEKELSRNSENNVVEINRNEMINVNNWNYQTQNNNLQLPRQAAMAVNSINSANGSGLNPIREGKVIESPTEEEIEERRNMEWIRHSNFQSDHGEGTETLDLTNEEKLKELNKQLGLDDLNELSDNSIINYNFQNLDNSNLNGLQTQPKTYLGFNQVNDFIGNTPPQLGVIGTYTSLSSNSHLSNISSITSLPPTKKNYNSGISSSSFIPFVPLPKLGQTINNNNNNNHLSGISSNGSNNLPFIPPIRGGHGSISGSGISNNIPSTILPRGYLSGLSSAYSNSYSNSYNNNQKNLKPRSPDSISIPSDIIIDSPPKMYQTGVNLQNNKNNNDSNCLNRYNSQSTISSYSNHPVSPYSSQPSFGVSRPNSQLSDTNITGNRNTRILTIYKVEKERNSRKAFIYSSPSKRRSSLNNLKRTYSGKLINTRDSLPPPLPNQNRKSAFDDADEEALGLSFNNNNRIPISNHTLKNSSPPPNSFVFNNDNLIRRSLKNQRESKGKYVPTIRLSQRALTPSFWIDEELLARFANNDDDDDDNGNDNTFVTSSTDGGSTIKPLKRKSKSLRSLEENHEAMNLDNSQEYEIEHNKNVQLERQSIATIRHQPSMTVTRINKEEKSSLPAYSTTPRRNSHASMSISSKDEYSSSTMIYQNENNLSRSDSNIKLKANKDEASISYSPIPNITPPNSSSVQPDNLNLNPSSLTPKPEPKKQERKQEKGKGKQKEIEIEKEIQDENENEILSPNTPTNKLNLLNPCFPKLPISPTNTSSSSSLISDCSSSKLSNNWEFQNNNNINQNFRFSIKQRKKKS